LKIYLSNSHSAWYSTFPSKVPHSFSHTLGNKTIVSLESSVVLANNTKFPIEILGMEEKYIKDIDYRSHSESFIIRPNKAFVVPLSWIMLNYAIGYIKEKEGVQRPDALIYRLAQMFCFENKDTEKNCQLEPDTYLLKADEEDMIYFSLDLHAFKCKPYKLDIPLQFLLSLNPPVCYMNHLFADLILYKGEDQKQLAEKIAPGEFKYLNSKAFELNERKSLRKNHSKYQWAFKKDRSITLCSEVENLYSSSREVAFLPLLHDGSLANK
jgi:hypothetical protein